ncbi:MAG: type II restriction endonuclease [Pseudomonadota bacterium]|nr:type II restriction endonuclease [Pseudomonadota bacterium]
MNKGHLSEYFEGVGVKTLSVVDAEPQKSNQHEIGTTVPMKKFLGTERKAFDVTYIWLSDEQETITEHGRATYYNTRDGKSRSPEYRLYYPSNAVTQVMSAGDTLFLAIRPDKTILFIVVPAESTIQSQILWLFGIEEQPGDGFIVQEFEGKDDSKLDFVSCFILDEIGIEFEDPAANSLDVIIERFGMNFPSTADFSSHARLTLPEVDARDDPDAALMAWLNHEESMFRRLEKRIVAARVAKGFMDTDGVNVDEFIHYSLEVHNRRKSRMGQAFQNQLKAVFDVFGLRYESQVITEKGKRPDFIFPGKKQYFDSAFDISLLTMLAAKSTCKDRWPQILPEAERILLKHLVTLEPGITIAQTTMMQNSNVQLVIPRPIQASYTQIQQIWLMNIADFVELVLARQRHI